jgi:hypothetical protein
MNEVLIIICIIVIIYLFSQNKQKDNIKDNIKDKAKLENYINITNPFIEGISQKKFAAQNKLVNDIPVNGYSNNPSSSSILYKKNRMAKDFYNNKKNRIFEDIDMLNALKINSKKKTCNNNNNNNNKNYKNNINNKIKLNKFFVSTQFNDSYRDVLTALNILCPDQKIVFNLQTLPVTTTAYDPKIAPPLIVIKLVGGFVNRLNNILKDLPESYEVINDYNNYLPMTSQLKKYVDDRGINKFYKDIGVDYNLYPDIPKNSPVKLIAITEMKQEYTEAETKYIVSIVYQKIVKTVTDQMKITIHFVMKNDPLAGEGLFGNIDNVNDTKKVAIEFVFTDGYFTNDYNVDYQSYENNNGKKISMTDGDDNFYSFEDLGKNSMMSDGQIISQFNKKLREHELEMVNFSKNIPYPVTN